MSNFLENIFAQLQRAEGRVVLREIRGDRLVSISGAELFEQVRRARCFLRAAGVQAGDRCALLAQNSIRWVVFDLALMAEGAIVVPLYSRQSPAELAGMMKDCQPKILFTDDSELGERVAQVWPGAPPRVLFEDALRQAAPQASPYEAPIPRQSSDLVTIIYTSGTSGEPKGVCLSIANLNHMLECTTERLDQLMQPRPGANPDRVFHYLPFNFAASWLLLLSCLTRETVLTLSTDLNQLAEEIPRSAPHYFLNVPTLLERVRRGVEDAISNQVAPIRSLFAKASEAWQRGDTGDGRAFDKLRLALARHLIFRRIKLRFGPNLRALICGSAPLAPETQQFFLMLGIPVLQAYGLTETTGICTMDDPREPVEPGCVGKAIHGVQMKLAENEEIIVRGPHIFAGYWNRPEETARILQDGWFHTGDQGELSARGNWRISGRIKNLIILNSGHNIPPEPLEEKIARQLPAAQHVVLVGNGRGYLAALITGAIEAPAVQAALDVLNRDLPHYRQIRRFAVLREAFSSDSGLLTANGKLRRDAIGKRFETEINRMYAAASEREIASRQSA